MKARELRCESDILKLSVEELDQEVATRYRVKDATTKIPAAANLQAALERRCGWVVTVEGPFSPTDPRFQGSIAADLPPLFAVVLREKAMERSFSAAAGETPEIAMCRAALLGPLELADYDLMEQPHHYVHIADENAAPIACCHYWRAQRPELEPALAVKMEPVAERVEVVVNRVLLADEQRVTPLLVTVGNKDIRPDAAPPAGPRGDDGTSQEKAHDHGWDALARRIHSISHVIAEQMDALQADQHAGVGPYPLIVYDEGDSVPPGLWEAIEEATRAHANVMGDAAQAGRARGGILLLNALTGEAASPERVLPLEDIAAFRQPETETLRGLIVRLAAREGLTTRFDASVWEDAALLAPVLSFLQPERAGSLWGIMLRYLDSLGYVIDVSSDIVHISLDDEDPRQDAQHAMARQAAAPAGPPRRALPAAYGRLLRSQTPLLKLGDVSEAARDALEPVIRQADIWLPYWLCQLWRGALCLRLVEEGGKVVGVEEVAPHLMRGLDRIGEGVRRERYEHWQVLNVRTTTPGVGLTALHWIISNLCKRAAERAGLHGPAPAWELDEAALVRLAVPMVGEAGFLASARLMALAAADLEARDRSWPMHYDGAAHIVTVGPRDDAPSAARVLRVECGDERADAALQRFVRAADVEERLVSWLLALQEDRELFLQLVADPFDGPIVSCLLMPPQTMRRGEGDGWRQVAADGEVVARFQEWQIEHVAVRDPAVATDALRLAIYSILLTVVARAGCNPLNTLMDWSFDGKLLEEKAARHAAGGETAATLFIARPNAVIVSPPARDPSVIPSRLLRAPVSVNLETCEVTVGERQTEAGARMMLDALCQAHEAGLMTDAEFAERAEACVRGADGGAHPEPHTLMASGDSRSVDVTIILSGAPQAMEVIGEFLSRAKIASKLPGWLVTLHREGRLYLELIERMDVRNPSGVGVVDCLDMPREEWARVQGLAGESLARYIFIAVWGEGDRHGKDISRAMAALKERVIPIILDRVAKVSGIPPEASYTWSLNEAALLDVARRQCVEEARAFDRDEPALSGVFLHNTGLDVTFHEMPHTDAVALYRFLKGSDLAAQLPGWYLSLADEAVLGLRLTYDGLRLARVEPIPSEQLHLLKEQHGDSVVKAAALADYMSKLAYGEGGDVRPEQRVFARPPEASAFEALRGVVKWLFERALTTAGLRQPDGFSRIHRSWQLSEVQLHHLAERERARRFLTPGVYRAGVRDQGASGENTCSPKKRADRRPGPLLKYGRMSGLGFTFDFLGLDGEAFVALVSFLVNTKLALHLPKWLRQFQHLYMVDLALHYENHRLVGFERISLEQMREFGINPRILSYAGPLQPEKGKPNRTDFICFARNDEMPVAAVLRNTVRWLIEQAVFGLIPPEDMASLHEHWTFNEIQLEDLAVKERTRDAGANPVLKQLPRVAEFGWAECEPSGPPADQVGVDPASPDSESLAIVQRALERPDSMPYEEWLKFITLGVHPDDLVEESRRAARPAARQHTFAPRHTDRLNLPSCQVRLALAPGAPADRFNERVTVAAEAAYRLVEDLCGRMRRGEARCGRIVIEVVTSDGIEATVRASGEAVRNPSPPDRGRIIHRFHSAEGLKVAEGNLRLPLSEPLPATCDGLPVRLVSAGGGYLSGWIAEASPEEVMLRITEATGSGIQYGWTVEVLAEEEGDR